MTRISRRKLADHSAEQIAQGVPVKKVVKQLGAFLLETRRTREVDLIIRDIETALARRGDVVANVVSARTLNDQTKAAIESFVKSQSNAKNVVLREAIDESVIGGVKIDFIGHQLDTTIKTKLEKLIVS